MTLRRRPKHPSTHGLHPPPCPGVTQPWIPRTPRVLDARRRRRHTSRWVHRSPADADDPRWGDRGSVKSPTGPSSRGGHRASPPMPTAPAVSELNSRAARAERPGVEGRPVPAGRDHRRARSAATLRWCPSVPAVGPVGSREPVRAGRMLDLGRTLRPCTPRTRPPSPPGSGPAGTRPGTSIAGCGSWTGAGRSGHGGLRRGGGDASRVVPTGSRMPTCSGTLVTRVTSSGVFGPSPTIRSATARASGSG